MVKLEKPEKFYFHYPFTVSIVVSVYKGKCNFMSAAWHTQISFKPPLYGVAISPKRYTRELIDRSGKFSVCFLKFEDYKIAGNVGRTSGKDIDKVKEFNLEYFLTDNLEVPILSNSISAYECTVVDAKEYGDHILYVGEILSVYYDENLYESGILKEKMLLYAGSDTYTPSGKEKIHYIPELGG